MTFTIIGYQSYLSIITAWHPNFTDFLMQNMCIIININDSWVVRAIYAIFLSSSTCKSCTVHGTELGGVWSLLSFCRWRCDPACDASNVWCCCETSAILHCLAVGLFPSWSNAHLHGHSRHFLCSGVQILWLYVLNMLQQRMQSIVGVFTNSAVYCTLGANTRCLQYTALLVQTPCIFIIRLTQW